MSDSHRDIPSIHLTPEQIEEARALLHQRLEHSFGGQLDVLREAVSDTDITWSAQDHSLTQIVDQCIDELVLRLEGHYGDDPPLFIQRRGNSYQAWFPYGEHEVADLPQRIREALVREVRPALLDHLRRAVSLISTAGVAALVATDAITPMPPDADLHDPAHENKFAALQMLWGEDRLAPDGVLALAYLRMGKGYLIDPLDNDPDTLRDIAVWRLASDVLPPRVLAWLDQWERIIRETADGERDERD